MGREVVVAITDGRLDFGPWEQIFCGEFDGRRMKGKGMSWSGRGASAMAKVRELLTNGELSQWCSRQAARGNSMQKPSVAVRPTTRKKRDQGEWLQVRVPALYGPSASKLWVQILRQMLHPHTY